MMKNQRSDIERVKLVKDSKKLELMNQSNKTK